MWNMMFLEDHTQEFSPIQLLNLIRLTLKTGKLRIDGQFTVELYFNDGELLYAASPQKSENLLSLLQFSGKLSEGYAQIIAKRAEGIDELFLSRWLLSEKYITKEDFAHAVYQHVMHLVYWTILYGEGSYTFEEDVLPSLDVPITAVNLKTIIKAGQQLLNEWDDISKAIPSLDLYPHYKEVTVEVEQRFAMSKIEWLVAKSCNARQTLRQIAQSLNLDEFQIRRIIHAFLQLDLVELLPNQTESQVQLSPA